MEALEICRRPIVLFDFDGTISLIREGWQKVMIPYFCGVIEALGTNENKDGILSLIHI